MLNNISSYNSEFIIINYIFNNFKYSNLIEKFLRIDDFFYDFHKKFFLNKKKIISIGSINDNLIISHLQNLIEKSKKRKILKILFNLVHDLLNIDKIKKNFFEKVKNIFNYNFINEYKKINYIEILKKYFFDENNNIYTGYKKLDNLLNGIQQGDFIVLAGRPAIGKTSFAMNIVKNLFLNNKIIIIFSLEMSVIQIFIRLISILTDIKQNNLKKNDFNDLDFKKFSFLIKNVNFDNLIIKDCSSLSPKDIENSINYYKRLNIIIEIIMIDYIQLMKSEIMSSSRVLEITEISRSLKLIAKNYNCVIFALSQLNRSIETRLEKIPILSDLRDSGSIEQDADIVMFLHKNLKNNNVNILISKNRNGEIGNIEFFFNNSLTKFYEI